MLTAAGVAAADLLAAGGLPAAGAVVSAAFMPSAIWISADLAVLLHIGKCNSESTGNKMALILAVGLGTDHFLHLQRKQGCQWHLTLGRPALLISCNINSTTPPCLGCLRRNVPQLKWLHALMRGIPPRASTHSICPCPTREFEVGLPFPSTRQGCSSRL